MSSGIFPQSVLPLCERSRQLVKTGRPYWVLEEGFITVISMMRLIRKPSLSYWSNRDILTPMTRPLSSFGVTILLLGQFRLSGSLVGATHWRSWNE